MAELILMNAQSRTLRALYGDPPASVQHATERHYQACAEGERVCTPSRDSELTPTESWYAEQESRHGKYAEMNAARPKRSRSWFGGKKEESEEPVQEALQLPARQQPQLTVQDQLRQQRQIADTSGVTETETKDGIFWFTVEEEKEKEKKKVSKWW